ncbi:GDSL-type esterase/lipase family protein [Streptomyces sp. NPDC002734]|uniref:GDSL-type esterase/lipase family protein n=1 Tax=Streptomyces sp. NPDC002734 TaxID=3154426 RepID=UPI0033204DC6
MLRFMPVGDSMTIGSAGEHTWRYRLWQHLRATLDAPFGIVGPREALHDPATDGPDAYAYAADVDPAFPRAHLAGWGEGWHHMMPLIGEEARAHRADVLLISLGLIDLGFYTNARQTADNVRRFVINAREVRPAVRMVMLPVIPNVRAAKDEDFALEVTRFNELLAQEVETLHTEHSPVLLAPVPPGWDIDHDTYDGTHPNASGEHKLAATFADVMHEEWGYGRRYEPSHP